MAQTAQIVPMWKFPHVQSYVNDYSETLLDTNLANLDDTSPHFLAVFASGEGIDNTIVSRTTARSFRDTFGPREFAKYGQPYSQAIAMLESAGGRATMHAMRVMPDDATFANSFLQCYYKADAANKKFSIFWVAKNFEDTNAPKTVAEFEAHLTDEPDEQAGYTGLMMAGVRAIGRGAYGNNYRWRLYQDTASEKEYRIKMNTIQLIKAVNGLTSLFTGSGSSVYSVKTDTTTFMNDLFDNNAVNGEIPVYYMINEENFYALYEAYVAFLEEVQAADTSVVVTIPDVDQFDPFFGVEVASSKANEYLSVLPTALTQAEQDALLAEDATYVYDATQYAPAGVTAVKFDEIQGNYLKGGSDGAFASKDKDARQAAIDAAYIKAFNGTFDKRILSPLRIPATVLFDANYSLAVKEVYAELAQLRNDAILYLDTGIMTSYSEENVSNMIADYKIFDRMELMDGSVSIPCISKNLHHYTMRDPETGRKITVTIAYFLATHFYNHYVVFGNHVPFANVKAEITGHIKDSLWPTVEVHENELREIFTENRFNWCEAVSENDFRRVCQLVAQIPGSDMIEENNVHVLFQLKRGIEAECRNRIYDFTDAYSRQDFREFILAKYSDWQGRKLQSLDIQFKQNAWEGERAIVHGYVSVVFRGLMKRIILEFDINRREYETDADA